MHRSLFILKDSALILHPSIYEVVIFVVVVLMNNTSMSQATQERQWKKKQSAYQWKTDLEANCKWWQWQYAHPENCYHK